MIFLFAYLVPLLLIIFSGKFFIQFLKRLNFGQQVRECGPDSHLKKSGIPTMGGLLLIGIFLLTALFLVELSFKVIIVLVVTFILALAGFLDDFLKIKFSRSLGLRAWQKLVLQFLAALLTATAAVKLNADLILLPFWGTISINIVLKFLLAILVVLGASNAVNLTDGLDGLAAGVTSVVCLTLASIFYLINLYDFSLLMLIMAGSCTAFLWYNANPAAVFMGDVGSLALGGFLAAAAVLSNTEFFLLLIGGIYVIETISVIIQVSYFKYSGGKRVFKMTPLHHHFELSGLAENKIVNRFVIITIVLALLAVSSLL